jgi:hypothetical protein
MNNITDSTSSGGGQLSDEALLELLIKVRQGTLSPAEAERLLSGTPEPVSDSNRQQRGQIPEESTPVYQRKGHEASAPLGQVKEGVLIVDTFAAHFAIQSAGLSGDLFHARYERGFPSVWVEGNTVTARFNYFSLGTLREWLRQAGEAKAEFSLNRTIPWKLQLRSHMSNFEINLRGLQFAGLEGDGSMNHIGLILDRPVGHVPLHYNSNVASSLEIRCPAQCPLRVEIHGNTNGAEVLGRKFASKSAWQTSDFETASGRYSIVLSGEASSLTVTYE